jgi:hypothetical protein
VHGVRAGVGDGHVGKRGADHVQCLCGGTFEHGVDAGVHRFCGGAVPGLGRAVAVLGVCGWRHDRHVGVCGCCELHGVCVRRVQCPVHVGVCSVCAWLCDR